MENINHNKDEEWEKLSNKYSLFISDTSDEEKTGKWLIHDTLNNLIKLSNNLLPFIDSEEIEAIKWTHRENKDKDFRWDKMPVMCVFSYTENKEKVWKILEDLGIKEKIWRSDKQTEKDWRNNGILNKESKKWNQKIKNQN